MSSEPVAAPASEDRAAPSRRGLVLIVSSPSGAGKTTLTRALLDKDRTLLLSVSVTTRPRRQNEADGVHYHFLRSVREFEQKREAGELLEWAQVHGEHFYGTPREPVVSALAEGRDVLFDIDVQGAAQVTKAMRACGRPIRRSPSSRATITATTTTCR